MLDSEACMRRYMYTIVQGDIRQDSWTKAEIRADVEALRGGRRQSRD